MTAGPDFLVLTGFLGSGKTTLLRDYLATPEAADTAVIVNEVGEIGLDGAILRESPGGEVAMALLSNGCVCCSTGSDLAFTVQALLDTERPGASGPLRRIILETSGLSKPGPVLRQLAVLAPYRMRVGIVATYDAERGPESAAYPEAAAQWAAGDTLVITKADRATPERLAAAAQEAGAVNPLATIVADPDRSTAVGAAFARRPGPPRFDALPEVADQAMSHPRVTVCLARTSRPVAYDDLAAWLDNLAGLLGERLLRLKGLVRVRESERPLLVQSVGTLFSAPRPCAGEEGASFLVVIARDLDADELHGVDPDLGLVVTTTREPGLRDLRKPALVAEAM